MKFKVNEIVTVIEDKKYSNGDVIKAGTKGRILTVYPFSISYLLLFDGAKDAHRVLETSLK